MNVSLFESHFYLRVEACCFSENNAVKYEVDAPCRVDSIQQVQVVYHARCSVPLARETVSIPEWGEVCNNLSPICWSKPLPKLIRTAADNM